MLILKCEGRHVREFHLCALDKEGTLPRSEATGNRISASTSEITSGVASRVHRTHASAFRAEDPVSLRCDSAITFNLHDNQKDERRLNIQ